MRFFHRLANTDLYLFLYLPCFDFVYRLHVMFILKRVVSSYSTQKSALGKHSSWDCALLLVSLLLHCTMIHMIIYFSLF